MRLIKLRSVTWILFLGLLSGCDNSASNNLALKKIEDQRTELIKLQTIITELQTQQLQNKVLNFANHTAMFTPSSNKFNSVLTDVGYFYVTLKSITPYVNGYKINIEIGNPNYATYSKVNLTTMYGKSDENGLLNLTTAKSQNTSLISDIKPGYWNEQSIIIAPAKSEDIDNIWITIAPETVKLTTPVQD